LHLDSGRPTMQGPRPARRGDDGSTSGLPPIETPSVSTACAAPGQTDRPSPFQRRRYLRRKVLTITTLFLLAGAATAFAAGDNVYTPGSSFTFAKGVGTKSKPVGMSFSENLAA